MANIWILAANGSRATIYSAASPIAQLVEVAAFSHPKARAKQLDLVSDRPGRTFDSMGAGRHAKAVEVEPKDQEQIRFAKSLSDRLERGRVESAFERLVLVAAPAFLGLLRANLSAPLQTMVTMEIAKDYTAFRADELRAQLPERL